MNWGQYVEAVQSARNGNDAMEATEFGIVGAPGVAAGAFLTSPYSETGEPDIQLTSFPKVILLVIFRKLIFPILK